jgi:histidinol-phosphate/aromatic aminotransferase/cobyric acid decarboxylase-like protein/ribosomal protein S18 acetylase RimI-like enzyme
MRTRAATVAISIADERDRETIYALRHEVYAQELHQHPENDSGRLTDRLDAVNVYLVAKRDGEIAGFVAITPPNALGYSVDKYFARERLPINCDPGLYEIRLLTVRSRYRRSSLAWLLMYAALRHVEAVGGRTVIAVGRIEVLGIYKKAGLTRLGLQIQSGAVTYELMTATVSDLRRQVRAFPGMLERLERTVDWEVAREPSGAARRCFHGGASFAAIGEDFDRLDQRHDVISADVLDAWFDPAPAVLEILTEHLAFAVKTSPPASGDGMRRAIARARGVPTASILAGAGSSDLIFAAFNQWTTSSSRVLILDPMYGEYAHVLEQVVGAHVDRARLSRARGYRVDEVDLRHIVEQGFDWVVLVNPNSPTGCHVRHDVLKRIVAAAPTSTRFWIDETYIDYVDPSQSLERKASSSDNIIVCKSMSKAYALSGIRAAYLCGPAAMVAELGRVMRPWAVSLPAQMAACEALKSTDYYRECWNETSRLRRVLRAGLERFGWKVFPGSANFLLCQLPATGPTAAELIDEARKAGLFLRDVRSMGQCFDERTLRITVKDGQTNTTMLQILETAVARLDGGRSERPTLHPSRRRLPAPVAVRAACSVHGRRHGDGEQVEGRARGSDSR